MTTRENIGLLIVGVLGCTLILQRCNRPTTVKGPAQISYQSAGSVIVIQHKDRATGRIVTQRVYEPDPGSTIITTDAQGDVTVHIRQFGVGTSLGLGIGISNKARIALDDRFAYFKRFGANLGIGLSLDKNDYQKGHLLDIADPYIGLSYVPTLRMPNTALVASYTTSRHVFVFVRLRF